MAVLAVRTQAHLLDQTEATLPHFLKPQLEEVEEVEPGPKQTACREAAGAAAVLARQGFWDQEALRHPAKATRAGHLFLHLTRTAQAAAAAVLVVLAATAQQARLLVLAGLARHRPSPALRQPLPRAGRAADLTGRQPPTRPPTPATAGWVRR
jgi:hypothetical protein